MHRAAQRNHLRRFSRNSCNHRGCDCAYRAQYRESNTAETSAVGTCGKICDQNGVQMRLPTDGRPRRAALPQGRPLFGADSAASKRKQCDSSAAELALSTSGAAHLLEAAGELVGGEVRGRLLVGHQGLEHRAHLPPPQCLSVYYIHPCCTLSGPRSSAKHGRLLEGHQRLEHRAHLPPPQCLSVYYIHPLLYPLRSQIECVWWLDTCCNRRAGTTKPGLT